MKTVFFYITLFFAAASFAKTPSTPPIIAQYYTISSDSAEQWKDEFKSNTPFTKLNRLYITFGKIVKTGGHFTVAIDGSENHLKQVLQTMKEKNPKAELFLTTRGTDDSDSYGGAANDPAFAQNVATLLKKYGLNGFDIDWEEDLNKADLDNLLIHLHSTLHANNKKLTLTVWPFMQPEYDIAVIKNNVDQINIMSYGTEITLNEIVAIFEGANFPADKIIGGIDTESPYQDVQDSLGPNGSIAQKSAYALSHHLAGMMEWRLDSDYTTTQKPLNATYQGAAQLWKSMMPAKR